MKNRLISFLLTLCILVAIPLSARYKYNPFTRKLDYYEAAADVDLGDLGDITLTGLATGNVLYYDGAAWVNLATGANAEVLTLAAGIPSWAAAGAPAAHAASHEVGGADLVDHDQLTNYLAAQHLTLPAGIAAVLTDHNLAAHTALGLYDAPGDVDHDLTTNYVANQHIDHTAVTFGVSGLISGGGTLAANRTFTLTEATIEAAIDTLGAVQFTGDVEFLEDIIVTWADAADRMRIIQNSETGIENQALIYIEDARSGATADEQIEATLYINTSGSYSLYVTQGQAKFDDNVTLTDDFYLIWAGLADHAEITQTSVTGIENQPLILIDDDRTGVTAGEESEATIYIDAEGAYALYILDGYTKYADNVYFGGTITNISSGKLILNDDIEFQMGTGGDIEQQYRTNSTQDAYYLIRTRKMGAGDSSAIFLTRTLEPWGDDFFNDWTSPTWIQTNDEGADNNDYAGVVIGERAQADVKVAHYFDFYAMTGAADGSVDPNAVEIGATFRFGDSGSTVPTYATGPGNVLFEDDIEVVETAHFLGDTTQYEDVFMTWADAADHMVISQTDTTGTDSQPLILIDDDRTGAYADVVGEATIVIDADGAYAFYILDGSFGTADNMYLAGDVVVSGTQLVINDSIAFKIGTQGDVWQYWNINDTADAHWAIKVDKYGADDTTAIVYAQDAYFWGNAELDDWLSPTFVIINDENADQYDYAAVIIGERAQADVEVAHYFDFYALTGTLRGSVDPTTTEIAAIFRFGPNGTGVPDNATTPGDVLFEGAIEINGNVYIDGEVFQGDYIISQVVNWDDVSPVTVCTVGDGYVVADAWCEVTTIADGDLVWTIGDGGTVDGFLTDGGITQGTLGYYGQIHSARGTYLFNAGEEVDKIYTGADTVDCFITETTASQGVIVVYVHITRLK